MRIVQGVFPAPLCPARKVGSAFLTILTAGKLQEVVRQVTIVMAVKLVRADNAFHLLAVPTALNYAALKLIASVRTAWSACPR